MKFRTAVFLSLGLAVGAAAPARADEAGQPADASVKPIVVNANFQTRIAVDPSASTSEVTKALAQANQSLGELANRECDVLAAAFKSECRVGQLNMGANINDRRVGLMMNNEFGAPQRFVNANLNATFELTPAFAKTSP
jgi:hypothetical protein